MMELKVEGYPGLVRDATTKAIVANDKNSFEAYVAEKRFRENIAKNNQVTQEDLQSVKQDVDYIKNMLHTLLQKLG